MLPPSKEPTFSSFTATGAPLYMNCPTLPKKPSPSENAACSSARHRTSKYAGTAGGNVHKGHDRHGGTITAKRAPAFAVVCT